MEERDWLQRLDRHMERSNEHMAKSNEHMARGNEYIARGNELMARIDEHMLRGNEHMARGNELMGEVREELRLNRKEREETRWFLRDLTLRHERVTRAQVEALNGIGSRMAEMREQIRAQTDAIFRLIDRLDGAGA